MNPKSLFYLIALLFLGAFSIQSCSSTKGLNSKEVFAFEFENGGCMDVCKAYTFSFNHLGEYDYTGFNNVRYKGSKTGSLSKDHYNALIELIESYDWKKLEENHDYMTTDSEQKVIKYTKNSANYTVVYYSRGPLELRKLEEYINNLIETDDF